MKQEELREKNNTCKNTIGLNLLLIFCKAYGIGAANPTNDKNGI